ncbi:MAG TPA: carboxypeptidase regulatory-like domain-containing protein [Longimicrobium sp.]|nr:carboxypeptidase regulatory-like domain-containing protein [Longimicrobium sp.]
MYPRRMQAGAVRGWMRAAAFALAVVAVDARGAHAQRVDGQVVDAETTVPIAGVAVQLLNEQGRVIHRAVSNGRGFFTLQARNPGLYRIHASRVGYAEATSEPIDLVSTRERDVYIRLSTSAVQLAPLTVTGIPRSARLRRRGSTSAASTSARTD